MNIVVCMKQVPQVADIKFDHETKTIVREGVPLQMNSLDRRAITQAVKLKESHGGAITVITLGPPQAKSLLAEALATGADRAIHIVGRAFAGSDTLATSRALAAAIKKLDYDVVFCGRFSIDAETGQVGPEVAELLGIPQATNLRRLEASADGKTFTVLRETEEGAETLEIKGPALFTAGEFLVTPIRPTADQVKEAMERPMDQWTLADLGLSADQVGSAGSPTSVSEIREMIVPREQKTLTGDDPDALARQAVDFLLKRGMFTAWDRPGASVRVPDSRKSSRRDRTVWVVAEMAQGRVREVTLELLGRGLELATESDGELAAVLIGHNVTQHAATLAAHGADRVYVADHASLAEYDTAAYAQVLAQAIQAKQPYAVLMGATVNGRDLAPRVAARLGLGLTGDCIGIGINAFDELEQLKPAFGGNIVAPIITRTYPVMATVRPGILSKAAANPSRKAVVETLAVTPIANNPVRHLKSESIAGDEGVRLDTAEVVVGLGAGVGSVDNIGVVRQFAQILDAPVGTTLKSVNTSLMPSQLQIGITGRSVSPRFYFAVAISGQLNHLIGLRKAGTIVAINSDPEAPIFKNCDLGIVGDYAQVLPALGRALQEAKAKRD
ncbi:MAG: hypothetical protein EXR51_07315 [Dehalococcoidia bacterium]|nr:hypothetical protein [Dehalococcoidia bacterium]